MNKNKGILIIILLAILLIILLLIPSFDTEGATTRRYVTKTVKLSKDLTVKAGTSVTLIKSGSKCTVKYQGGVYKVHKKYLNTEGLTSAKKTRKYIRQLKRRNPVRWHGRKYTYYTSRRFPVHRLPIKGLHLDKNGIWCDKDGYIVLGSSRANRVKRKVFATPFGKYGKVYDTGGVSTPGWLCDVATNW